MRAPVRPPLDPSCRSAPVPLRSRLWVLSRPEAAAGEECEDVCEGEQGWAGMVLVLKNTHAQNRTLAPPKREFFIDSLSAGEGGERETLSFCPVPS